MKETLFDGSDDIPCPWDLFRLSDHRVRLGVEPTRGKPSVKVG